MNKTEDVFLDMLWDHLIRNHRSQAKAARFFDVSDSFMSAVLRGKKSPTKAMLENIGYEREVIKTVIYRKAGGRDGKG